MLGIRMSVETDSVYLLPASRVARARRSGPLDLIYFHFVTRRYLIVDITERL
ncbi:hypothetical protein STEG23_019335, partial [Scotinomys teguina]